MAQLQTQSLPRETFLLVAVNLLQKALVDVSRTQAKQLFNQIVAGKTVHLTTVRMEDNSTAAFRLSLAHDEFCGKLNYGAFRASILTLIGNISRVLREKQELRVFNALNGGAAMIFGITAVTVEDRQTNVMVLAADPGQDEDATTLQLMYLDPTQFAARNPAVTTAPVS
jgi:hypothetical protein